MLFLAPNKYSKSINSSTESLCVCQNADWQRQNNQRQISIFWSLALTVSLLQWSAYLSLTDNLFQYLPPETRENHSGSEVDDKGEAKL